MEYDANQVRVFMKLHSSNCASHKSTFSHYKIVSEEELREYLESFDEVTYKEETLYGACGRWFYVDDKKLPKLFLIMVRCVTISIQKKDMERSLNVIVT